MSRRPTGEEKQGIALVFDTNRRDENPTVYLPIENKILEIVLALSLFMSEKNVPVSYFYNPNDDQKNIRQGRLDSIRDVEGFYEQMREVHFEAGSDIHGDIAWIMQRGLLTEMPVVFFVLSEIDDAIMNMTHRLAGDGALVIYYVVTDENIEEFCSMSDLNRRIIAMTPEEELEDVL